MGGSVARASEAKESIITFSHSIWMALIGDSLIMKPEMMARAIATRFTVS